MRPSLASRLGELRDAYIRDLDSRSAARKESDEVRRAKEDILVQLTAIDPDPPASASLSERATIQNKQLAQIEERIALLDRIEFDETTDLSVAGGVQRFKHSQFTGEGFLVSIIRSIVSAVGKMMHFEDVVASARAMLQAERELLSSQVASSQQILSLSSPEVLAARPHLTTARLASVRQETIDSAMTDFARNTYLNGKLYSNEGGADAAYTAAMEERIRALTGEADINKGYAGEIAHTPAQGFATPIVNEFLDHVPSLDTRGDRPTMLEPIYGRNKLGWSAAEDEKGGFFLRMETHVRVVSDRATGEFYAASPDPRATTPIKINDVDVMGLTSATTEAPPLFTIQALLRYTLAPGADRPEGHVERIEIANRYPQSYPFSEADQAVANPAIADADSSAPAAGAGTATAVAHAPAAGGAGAALPHWMTPPSSHTASSGASHSARPAPMRATGETGDREGRGESGTHPGGHG